MNEKIALVSGASRSLGAELVKLLISGGYFVIGIARSPIETWEIHPTENFYAHQCDVTDDSQVKRLFSLIRKRYQFIDILVNNAALFNAELIQGTTASRFLNVLDTNLVGTMLITREAAKLMRSRNYGRVVTISSIASATRIPGNAIYGISKRAVEGLMTDFATEFREMGITFNSVAISFIEGTSMVGTLGSEARNKYESRLLVQRPLASIEIFHAIKFFASSLSGSITGQVLALGSPE